LANVSIDIETPFIMGVKDSLKMAITISCTRASSGVFETLSFTFT
jgi:hypothetical protein